MDHNYSDDEHEVIDAGIDICPECGEAECDRTCMAYVLIDGDPCPHCFSRHTERVDTLHQEADFTIWIEQCGTCGKTFEHLIEA